MTKSVPVRSRGQGRYRWMVRALGTRLLFDCDFPEQLERNSLASEVKEELISEGHGCERIASIPKVEGLVRTRFHTRQGNKSCREKWVLREED